MASLDRSRTRSEARFGWRRSSASSRSATSGSSTATIVTPSPAAPSAARASRSSRDSSRPSCSRLLERDPSAIGLACAQPRFAERDEDLGQPCRCRPSAGKSLGALQQLDRVLPGQPRDGLPPGVQRVRECGLGIRPGAGERVMCERGQPLLGRAVGPFGQRLRDAAVEVGTPRGRQLSDERVSHQRVHEREPLTSRQLAQQARVQGVVERVQHRLLRLARRHAHELCIELGAGDRGDLEQPSCALREPAGTCGDDVAYGIGERDRLALPGVLRQLPNEERVPTGSLTERTGYGRIRAVPRQRLDDRGDGRFVEPLQGHADDRPVAPDRRRAPP